MNQPNCEELKDVEEIREDSSLCDWLQNKARQYKLQYLLAHADDGVVWGKFSEDGCKLKTSGDNNVFPQLAKLRLCTLQQCRVFGDKAEVMLWKVGQNWKARAIVEDEHPSGNDYISEEQILWGRGIGRIEKSGFTLVSDGSQGLKHAVPLTGIPFQGKGYRPLRLKVRHYIDYDESGVARIYLSRLVNLRGI